jgi:hypothetical protein
MTAFDRAWDIAKMPLDLNSVRVINDSDDDFEATASFIHPHDPERRYPMRVLSNDGIEYGVSIKDPYNPEIHHNPHLPEGKREIVRPRKVASANIRPVEIDMADEDTGEPSPMMWLHHYGRSPNESQYVIESLLDENESSYTEDERQSLRDLIERIENTPIDEDIGQRFMENRANTGSDLSVDEGYRRLGMGSAMYDLLTELGFKVSPDVNQDLRGRLMWLNNQGITDHKFAPPYEYPDGGRGHKRLGDLEYDFDRLGNEVPPYWRGLRERRANA